MENKAATFVFKNRRFFTIAAYITPIVLKSFLHGTTNSRFFIAGFIVVALGISFRIFSAGYMLGRHIVTKVGADHLCTFGPYAHIRNPLYIGNMLVGLGASIALNEWYAYAIILLNYIFMYLIIIPHEERFLQEKFGAEYLDYKNQVRRFAPKLRGYENKTRVIFSLKLGFLAEKYFVIILLINFICLYLIFVR